MVSPAPRRWPRRLARIAAVGCAVAVVAAVAGWYAKVLPWYEPIRDETIDAVERHWALTTSHPGWSFPGEIYSASAPADLPLARRLLHARARGYVDACPPQRPGEICPTTGEVLLRGGRFPDGPQPPEPAPWTRPRAFEPISLGWLVGPDAELRAHLPRDNAPPHLIAALIASEDERFRTHVGVDLEGLVRAAWANWEAGHVTQGGSTLSMQLLRNLMSERDRSYARKLTEMARAIAADRHLGKDRVLQMYLDAPYLGQTGSFSVCGFEMAARYYFGVGAADLTLDQAATLVGILPAPAKFAPDQHPDLARQKRDRVLRRMAELGWDAAAIDAALAQPVEAIPHPLVPVEKHPTYLGATRDALLTVLPPEVVYGAGLQVYTALDPVVQARTEATLEAQTPFLDRVLYGRGVGPLLSVGAIVDPSTGQLVAAHDTAQTDSAGFNRVTQMRRQAGSSFKPVVYALAFEPGPDGQPRYRPTDTVPNVPRAFGTGADRWTPRNSNGWYMSQVTLARALATSANIAAANLMERLGGADAVIDFADRVGFDTKGFPHEWGLSLGQAEVTPQEMARFVGTVLGDGKRIDASPVVVAFDAFGRERYRGSLPQTQAISPDAATYTRELMRLVVTTGTGWSVHGRHGVDGYHGDIVGKTGTATDDRDVWFIGGTPQYAGAVWVGYELPANVGGHASEVAAPLFGWWMDAIHDGLPPPTFDQDGVTRRYVCAGTGLAANASCPIIQMPFLHGETVKGACGVTHDPSELAPPPPKDPNAAVPGATPAPVPAPP